MADASAVNTIAMQNKGMVEGKWRAYGVDGNAPFFTILFYKYVTIEDTEQFARQQQEHCKRLELGGRILISKEGINGTLAGTREHLEEFVNDVMRADERFVDVDFKGSSADSQPFPDLLIRVVAEIISTGGVVPPPQDARAQQTGALPGEALQPAVWHERLASEGITDGSAEEAVLLDCRNAKESQIGTFAGAERVPMRTFAEWPKWVDDQLDRLRGKRVYMFCTGGVRCEKGSAMLKARGVKDVFHLRGGIHRYLEANPDGGHYKGLNFIFDKRIAMPPPGREQDYEVYGRCDECAAPFDKLDGGCVCEVCRDNCLVCYDCRAKCNHRVFCPDHQLFKGIYFHHLDDFSPEQLREQRATLQGMLDAAAASARGSRKQPRPRAGEGLAQEPAGKRRAGAAAAAGGAAGEEEAKAGEATPAAPAALSKNRRRTIRRQLARLDARLAALESGEAQVKPLVDGRPPCRTCGQQECRGTCWGFWADDKHAPREWHTRRPDVLKAEAEAAAAAGAAE